MGALSKYKNLLLFLVIFGVIVGGYLYYTKQQPLGDGATSTSDAEQSATAVEARAAQQELISLLQNLRSIQLDLSIFEDPAFRSLQDFTPVIEPEPVGRTNPFAPTGGGTTGTGNRPR